MSHGMLGEQPTAWRSSLKKLFLAQKYTVVVLLCMLVYVLSACSGLASGSGVKPTASSGTGGAAGGGENMTTAATPTAQVQPGVRPCPAVVSEPSYWDPIVITQSGVNAVTSVSCGSLTGGRALQALVTVVYEGTGQVADIYVFGNITSPNPTKLFFLQGLYKGSAKISAYGTVLTAEVDQGSSVNQQNQSNGNYQQDLFREFQWSEGAGTFVPVSFPGIFPDLTRYQAENDQLRVNQGKDSWKLDAAAVATRLANQLLSWTSGASANITSGGGKHDRNASVAVKNTSGEAIQVTLGRLEGNTNTGIWEATSVTTSNLSISTPQNRDVLYSPFSVTGTGNAVGGKVGTIKVLDHLYTDVTKGTANAMGTSASGTTSFSANVSYTTSFKTGAQDGLVILDTGTGAVILKELLE